jgi:dCTP deaminase
MILSDREIKAALTRESVRIEPYPGDDSWSSTAVDLTLAGELRRWKQASGARYRPGVFCPAAADFNYSQLVDEHTEVISLAADGYRLKPRTFVLGWTAETIQLPQRSRIAARVEGKSSLARLGLGVHVTAPTIHAGFGYDESKPHFRGNPIQLEIYNVGPLTIQLEKGMRICQLIFEEVHGTPEKGYTGRFAVQGPPVPEPPKN